jgi:gluconolactonase
MAPGGNSSYDEVARLVSLSDSRCAMLIVLSSSVCGQQEKRRNGPLWKVQPGAILTLILITLGASRVLAQDTIVPSRARLEKVWSEGEFTEGPAYGPGGFVYFSDIGNRILRFDPRSAKTAVYREPSGRANGLDFDPQGRLVAAEGANNGGQRRITITEKDGTLRVLADRWQGKRFNSPNDLTVDTRGRVYFTDPRYVGDERREIATESVYRVDPDGTVIQIITDVEKPNGIVLSPDMKNPLPGGQQPGWKSASSRLRPGSRWQCVQPQAAAARFRQRAGHRRHVRRWGREHLWRGGQRSERRRLCFRSGRQAIGLHPHAETPTNCVFGGKERKTL